MRLLLVTLLLVSSAVNSQTSNYSQNYSQLYAQTRLPGFEEGVDAARAGNYAEAYCIWKPLAESGHMEAQYRLGWLYAKGLGLAVNESTALGWWTQAAERGHTDALFRLGWAYQHGEGVETDLTRAVDYYLDAARKNQEDALEILEFMFMRGNKEVMAGVAEILAANPETFGNMQQVSVKRANVRNAANKNGKLLITLAEGDKLVVLGNRGNWLRVWLVDSQQYGWIFNRLVTGHGKQG